MSEPRYVPGTEEILPPHRTDGGTFQSPWGDSHGASGAIKWYWQRLFQKLPPDPDPSELPPGEPRIVRPRVPVEEFRATWVGHSSVFLQMGGVNILFDPMWSRRCFPVQWLGPKRIVPPGVALEELPPIDVVLQSHDHYDHLDRNSVVRIRDLWGDRVTWVTPLAYRSWYGGLGIRRVVELDWWQSTSVVTEGGEIEVSAVASRHWTRRGLLGNRRLWASYAVRAPGGHSALLIGDSGYFPEMEAIGEHFGPFDLCGIPIGAYDPRWFMKVAHMCPEESVKTYMDVGGQGVMLPLHWGTFRLTDEDMLEPPVRLQAAWDEAGLPAADLWRPRHGDTRVIASANEEATEHDVHQ